MAEVIRISKPITSGAFGVYGDPIPGFELGTMVEIQFDSKLACHASLFRITSLANGQVLYSPDLDL